MNRSVWAVVVARLGTTAKSRLAPVLTGEERALLARAMLADVLAAVQGAALPVVAVLASDGAHPGEGASDHLVFAAGTTLVTDPGGGMNAAVTAGITAALAAGATAALVLPGDVPLATPEDVWAMLTVAGSERRGVALVRDRWRTGTNALLLMPADLVAPSFGAMSADRHIAGAHAAGALATDLDIPHLAFDVDTPADLTRLFLSRPHGQVAGLVERLRHSGRGDSRLPLLPAPAAVAPCRAMG